VILSILGASFTVEKAIDDPDLANATLQQDIEETGDQDKEDEVSPDPLSDLGVTPVPKIDNDEQSAEVAEPGANPVSEEENFDELQNETQP